MNHQKHGRMEKVRKEDLQSGRKEDRKFVSGGGVGGAAFTERPDGTVKVDVLGSPKKEKKSQCWRVGDP